MYADVPVLSSDFFSFMLFHSRSTSSNVIVSSGISSERDSRLACSAIVL